MNFDWPEEFEQYLDELLKWNKMFNLTSITDREEAKFRHFYDSLSLREAFDFSGSKLSIIDIGSGAGFPGLPMKIIFPNIYLTLLDATAKKIKFLEHIIVLLKLEGAEAVWSRAEDYARKKTEQYDAAFCRALAPLNIAVELCLPFVKKGGRVFAMKGKDIGSELSESENALKILGGRVERIVVPRVPDGKNGYLDRSIVVIEKIHNIPPGYPRKAGFPKKRPL
ncbi:MAG: 16S rRNA (guanine(527)-N(7))-methyltransferase RsmG [Candidatus Margulisiibacteriota bacterium]